MKKARTDKEYKDIISQTNPNVINLDPYIANNKKIKHVCLIDGYSWDVLPASIMNGCGCPVCANNIVVQGINDLWMTNPETASLLLNSNDGYKFSKMSNKRTDWKCPDCGNIIKNRVVSTVSIYGLKCNACSDSISIPNKFIYNILNSLGVNYIKEKSFSWLPNRHYDVYIPSVNCIIEMHGGMHYEESFVKTGSKSLKEIQEIDILKECTAKINGIENYIIIDARYSELEFIRHNIMTSLLCNLFDLSTIDWETSFINSQKSILIEACRLWGNNKSIIDIANIVNVDKSTVRRYLNRGAKLGLCTYNGRDEISRKVISLDINKIYDSITDAATENNLTFNQVEYSCSIKGRPFERRDHVGKQRFMYYDDYVLMNRGVAHA